jgi:Tannase and feruloyl esterase
MWQKVKFWIAFALLLLLGVVGIIDAVNELPTVRGLQAVVTSGVLLYGVLGIAAAVAVLMRRRIARWLTAIWAVDVTAVAFLAPIAYGGSDVTIAGAIAGGVGSALVGFWVWWVVSRRVAPANPVASASVALALIVAVSGNASAQTPPLVSARDSACAALRNLRLPDVRFTEVVDAPDSLAHGDNVRAPHCRVSGVISREIAFTVMLPAQWNQRLLMGGNGGYAGTINRGVLSNATNGYVTVSTNTGHEASPGGGARWALNDLERQLNYGFAGVHRTAEVAKVLARAFYGSEPRYSYFNGCSNGGRQGLMELQRFPEDFDGVISGAPAAHFSKIILSFFKNVRAAYPTPAAFDHPVVTQANLDLVATKILDACDALDGVRDSILADPRDCKFRLASLKACPGDRAASSCLTTAQRNAIARVYAPATDEKGRPMYPGQPFGGENLPGGWPAWIVGRDTGLMRVLHVPSAQAMFLTEGGKYFLFSDSTWDYSRYHGPFAADAARLAPLGDADDPNISPFLSRKGKLILYHGWADPALNPLATIDYYEKVLAANPSSGDAVRLFMMPGVLHCAGGPGPADVAWLRAIVDWVEHDQAPERLVATKRDDGKVTRTRPLCAYPKRAAYIGTGSTNDANNFECRDR